MKSSEYPEEFPRKFRGNTKFGFLGIPSENSEGFPRKEEIPRNYFRRLVSSILWLSVTPRSPPSDDLTSLSSNPEKGADVADLWSKSKLGLNAILSGEIDRKGYGFITPNDGGAWSIFVHQLLWSIFVHQSSIRSRLAPVKTMKQNLRVRVEKVPVTGADASAPPLSLDSTPPIATNRSF
ncbi:hypothetical protein F2Q70_00022112 [Brassica cretica]|uniref:CSD domain-containing protein n=1 Tax=Brassica cretica TaxID=69181 RepID=A0A8S9GJA0_BRACR|nr:hypothetical protein F2Q70_00022112 [Brassica cretica]